MTISWRVQQQFFAPSGSPQSEAIIRLPLTLLDQIDYWSLPTTPSSTVVHGSAHVAHRGALPNLEPPKRRANLWTAEEHERFLRGLELFPRGPWKRIASVVRTKTTRQTMTHAQKYRQKIQRHQRIAESVVSATPAVKSRPPQLQPLIGPIGARQAPFRTAAPVIHVSPVAERSSMWVKGNRVEVDEDPELLALLESLGPLDGIDTCFVPHWYQSVVHSPTMSNE